ncbi:MAG: endonuclease/exonuclease/phosphatase family protein [Gemmatimonadota bacterium]|nr:endonuclease/exonuclease/phosphatase family protein [Gemmatimonadota bacterium]MDH5198905.1 endonuclease/exonuclease/phosphatase family protein [Gemmatimonadota bacterium]
MVNSVLRFWNAARPADVVVWCAAHTHRVRLARGRFWAGARCPACGAAVDPFRVRRVGAWVARLAHPAALRTIPRFLWVATAAYLVIVAVAVGAIWLLADRWWLATVLLFGPRWVLALPLVFLLPAAVVVDRPLLAPLLLATLVVAGPIIGLHTGWRRVFVAPDPVRDIRVMSFNTEGERGLAWAPAGVLEALEVDVAALQECRGEIARRMATLEGWHTDARGGACLVSRFPILAVSQMDRDAVRAAGGAGLVVTYRLDVEGREIQLTNLHLDTPRKGLEAIRSGRIDEGAPMLEGKSAIRTLEHRFARQWVDTLAGPRLVLGDFNSPPESPMYRSHWGDWQNAFSQVGVGLGGTRLNGWIRARIDHILADDAWIVVRSWLGPTLASDHAPILADLRLR